MIDWPPSPQPARSDLLSKFSPWKSQSKATSTIGISNTAPAGASRHPIRQFFKQTLSWSRVKLLYARVTLTRFTTAYFFLASCALFTLAALHALTFSDNVAAIKVLETAITSQISNFIYNGSSTEVAQSLVEDATHKRFVILQKNVLSVCDSLPGQPGTTCAGILVFSGGKTSDQKREVFKYRRDADGDAEDGGGVGLGDDDDDDDSVTTLLSSSSSGPTSTFSTTAVSTTGSSTIFSSSLASFTPSPSTQVASTTTVFSTIRPSPPVFRSPQKEDDSVDNDDVKTIFKSASTETKLATRTATVTSIMTPKPTSSALVDKVPVAATASPLVLEETCVLSLEWLNETLHDAQREDVVTFLFQVWLFALALVTILTESIPHLLTALLGHALGAGWAAYRLSSIISLERFYKNHIMPEACANRDLMGEWWTMRIRHAIPLVVVNGITFLGIVYLSFMLFKVYARETFSRVGASPVIHRIYKIVLVFSAFLQLSGFFSIASSAMWIDKMCHGTLMLVARHADFYRALLIVGLLLQIPWLVLGWVCVRRECRYRFGVFCAMSLILWVIPTVMFTRPVYLYIISTWPFFTAVTVTAYAVLVVSAILGILCRLNFGKGLKHYLEVTDVLEGVDFTPVVFPKYGDEKDPEKFVFNDSGAQRANSVSGLKSLHLQVPERSGTGLRPDDNGQDANKFMGRGHSVYSDDASSPVVFSASPPLVSELTPAPRGKSILAKARNVRRSIVPPYPPVSTAGAAISNTLTPRPSMDTTSSDASSKGSVSASITRPVTAAVVLGRAKQGTLSGRSVSGRQDLPANPRTGLKRLDE